MKKFDYTAFGKGKIYITLQEILTRENDEILINRVTTILNHFNKYLSAMKNIDNNLVNVCLYDHMLNQQRNFCDKLESDFPSSNCHTYVRNITRTKIKLHFKETSVLGNRHENRI